MQNTILLNPLGSHVHIVVKITTITNKTHIQLEPLSPNSPFFLSTQNDPSTLELIYYIDRSKREKRGSINLAKFIGIRPNAKVGNKENIFAIEVEDRKYILRAPDLTTKNIWLAKLCELCGQG